MEILSAFYESTLNARIFPKGKLKILTCKRVHLSFLDNASAVTTNLRKRFYAFL